MRSYYEVNTKGMVVGKRLKVSSFDKIVYPYVFKADVMNFENVSNKYTYPVLSMLDGENMVLWKLGSENGK